MQPLETLLAPELQEARKRRRHWLAIGGAFVAAAVVVAVEYHPIYEWMQGVRARRLAVKAEAEILNGNLEEAAVKARTAYHTKSDEPAAIRIAARVQRLAGQPGAAIPLWQQLLKINAMRDEDRRPFAEDLLATGATTEAGVEIEALLKRNPPEAAVLRLAARWAGVCGDGAKARDFAARAVRAEPGGQEGRLLLALLQLAAGSEALKSEALPALLELGREPTREGLEALKVLGTLRGIPLEVAREVRPLLLQHPLATEQHRILGLSIELALHPEQSAALLDAAVLKYRKAEPADRCAFGMWLHARGDNERVLAVVPIEEAFKRQDLLRVALNALAGLQRWNEIERILEMKDVPLDTAIKELYLARAAEELGSKTVAELHWRRAHLAAGPSPEHMREIAEYAEKCRRPDQAEMAYRSLSTKANTARFSLEALLKIARARGDLEMLCEILAKMHARWPKDDSVKNDLAYFRLLSGKAVDESFAAAKELVARSPRNLPHLTTLALGAMRKSDPAAALAVYKDLQIPWERIATGQRAIHAAALGANGLTDEARREVAALNWDELRPEERALILPWRTP